VYSACNCIYQLRGSESDITGLSCKQTVGQSQLGILGSWAIFSSRIERVLLGQRNLTILVAEKFGRFLHDRRQIFVGRFYWQTKLANFIVRLTSALKSQQAMHDAVRYSLVCGGHFCGAPVRQNMHESASFNGRGHRGHTPVSARLYKNSC